MQRAGGRRGRRPLQLEFLVLVQLVEVDLLVLVLERSLNLPFPSLFAFDGSLSLATSLRVSHYIA